ncbi:hypothetical protein [Erwinia sp. MYb416]|uniref:hypothetical protein n=1 Tax=Erwinia sp. MYb416 TaxID=3108532 RepID=UPI0030AEF48F
MTVISSVGNLSVNTLPGATKLATTAAAVDTLQTPPLSSTTVSLGQSAAAPPVYSLPRVSTAATQTDNQGTLSVKTASGAEVELTQASDGSGVQIKVNKGTLSEAERSALEKLSDGFKKAMEGLTGQPPRLDLSGLTRFNSAVLTSVDLQAKVTGENKLTLAFHADTNTRSVKSTGTLGTVDISVDMSKRAILGNESQQQRALSQYLKQFDRAQSRGEGNSTLMTMFKDAFTALNSHYDHKALTSGLQLALTADRNAQNYFYTQIDDKAESTTEVQYRKGALVSATLDQSASTPLRIICASIHCQISGKRCC